MKGRIATLLVVVALVVGLPVMVAVADTIFLPLVAKAGDGLAGLIRVEDNVVASSDGSRLAFKGPQDLLYIEEGNLAELVVLDGRIQVRWPGAENLEWGDGNELFVCFSDGTAVFVPAGSWEAGHVKVIPPSPTPTETATPPRPTVEPTPTMTPTEPRPTVAPTPTMTPQQ